MFFFFLFNFLLEVGIFSRRFRNQFSATEKNAPHVFCVTTESPFRRWLVRRRRRWGVKLSGGVGGSDKDKVVPQSFIVLLLEHPLFRIVVLKAWSVPGVFGCERMVIQIGDRGRFVAGFHIAVGKAEVSELVVVVDTFEEVVLLPPLKNHVRIRKVPVINPFVVVFSVTFPAHEILNKVGEVVDVGYVVVLAGETTFKVGYRSSAEDLFDVINFFVNPTLCGESFFKFIF